jgi:hypothetical protein
MLFINLYLPVLTYFSIHHAQTRANTSQKKHKIKNPLFTIHMWQCQPEGAEDTADHEHVVVGALKCYVAQ